jgi:hypothetical protein
MLHKEATTYMKRLAVPGEEPQHTCISSFGNSNCALRNVGLLVGSDRKECKYINVEMS